MISSQNSTKPYQGNDKVLIGFILGLLSFWLFAMTLLNIQGDMNQELGLNLSILNIAVSITSLISGIFIVYFGGLADKYGRVRITHLGFLSATIGSILIAVTPASSVLTAPIIILGRIFQGLSGALIMPATLALINTYWDEKGRQRAISLWSMGTWGGTSFAALFGGFMVNYVGWRSIFIVAAVLSVIGYLLCRNIPEVKGQGSNSSNREDKFDVSGFVTFMIAIIGLLVYATQGSALGWTSAIGLGIIGVALIALVAFIIIEQKVARPFVDFSLFKNGTFTGATISNFVINGTAGVLIITLSLIQQAGGKSADEAGYLTIGYGVTIIAFIRLGEKLLQRYGARKPMLWGCLILILSAVMLSFTNVMTNTYMWLMLIAYIFFGLGLAFYATPSTDAALSNLPKDQVGKGSGIYKMASSLGSAFGLALSTAIYNTYMEAGKPVEILNSLIDFQGNQMNLHFRHGALIAMVFNIALILVAIISISLTVHDRRWRRNPFRHTYRNNKKQKHSINSLFNVLKYDK